MKKIILAVMVLAVLFSAASYYISLKSPDLLRQTIEKIVNRPVKIEAIEYHFPWTFEIKNIQILETKAPFLNEVSFSAGMIILDISPLTFSQKRIVLENVEILDAQIFVRQHMGRRYYFIAEPAMSSRSDAEKKPDANSIRSNATFLIRRLHVGASRIYWLDYDVQDSGFAIELDRVEANFKDIYYPFKSEKTWYRLHAGIVQGRQRKQADLKINGSSSFDSLKTDAVLSVKDLFVPHFKPYYNQVTSADIEDGNLSVRASVLIQDHILTAHSDSEISALYFREYENNGQLFGFKADEIIAFLKDSHGKLKFQASIGFGLKDSPGKKIKTMRDAIEQSLKKVVVRSVGANALENAIKELSADPLGPEKDVDADTPNKMKNLFN